MCYSCEYCPHSTEAAGSYSANTHDAPLDWSCRMRYKELCDLDPSANPDSSTSCTRETAAPGDTATATSNNPHTQSFSCPFCAESREDDEKCCSTSRVMVLPVRVFMNICIYSINLYLLKYFFMYPVIFKVQLYWWQWRWWWSDCTHDAVP